MKIIVGLLGCLFLFSSSFLLAADDSNVVHFCDDGDEWLPYIYYERIDGNINQKKVVGAMVEVLDEVFKMINMEYTVRLIPWRRCLMEVEDYGSSNKYEAIVNASFKERRLEKYWATTPLYNTTAAFWYSKKRFPEGPDIKTFSDLEKYKICGIRGYGYAGYFPSRTDDEIDKIVNRSAGGAKQALMQLDRERCEIFLSNQPSVYGKQTIGALEISDSIHSRVVPTARPGPFHLYISKQSPRAYELLTKINQALVILHGRGTFDEIFEKYLKCGRTC